MREAIRPPKNKGKDMIHTTTPERREIDIRRPDGTTETVDVSKTIYRLDVETAAKIKAATMAAGRGELIAWRVIPAVTVDDHICHCDRCGDNCDDRTAYIQMQRHNGMPVKAHYCADCANLLNMIGYGEHTAMADRAIAIEDRTPDTK